jgi:nucleoside diphosphate kinase
MAEEISYVLVTPYSIRKSRTGGIIARLISRTGLDLVAARMFAPSAELVANYAAGIVSDPDPTHRATQELIKKYVLKNLTPTAAGASRPRVLMLVFKGDEAVSKIRATVGHIVNERTSGETIRDTYGDYVEDENGEVAYFEPGVLAPPDAPSARRDMLLWASYSDKDGGLVDHAIQFPPGTKVEKTLVLIKPDNFRFPNARAGGVIDLFSRSGLYIVACKVHRMSVAQAEEFYGPVLPVLQDKLKAPPARRRAAVLCETNIELGKDVEAQLGEVLGPIAGRENWEQIVAFMAGIKPSECPAERRDDPGRKSASRFATSASSRAQNSAKCSDRPIRQKRPRHHSPRVRLDHHGQCAHASDSAENAEREMGIVKISENNLKPLIESWFAKN